MLAYGSGSRLSRCGSWQRDLRARGDQVRPPGACTRTRPKCARAVFEEVNGFSPQDGLFEDAFSGRMACSYDVAQLSQVLEHLAHSSEAVQSLHTVLRPGGIAAMAVPHFG